MLSSRIDNAVKVELDKLSKDFDCIGLPTINTNVDVLHQLITVTARLVHIHRNSLSKSQEAKIRSEQLRGELTQSQNRIDDLKEELNTCQSKLNYENNVNLKLQSIIDDLAKQLHENKCDLQRSRSYNDNKTKEWTVKLNKMQSEINQLKNNYVTSPKPRSGTDQKLVESLTQYKLREEIYKDTIKQLQGNNDELLRQLINLREDILQNNPTGNT